MLEPISLLTEFELVIVDQKQWTLALPGKEISRSVLRRLLKGQSLETRVFTTSNQPSDHASKLAQRNLILLFLGARCLTVVITSQTNILTVSVVLNSSNQDKGGYILHVGPQRHGSHLEVPQVLTKAKQNVSIVYSWPLVKGMSQKERR